MHFISFKKETSNYSKCYAFVYFALLHQFFNSNSISFVKGGAQEYFLPQGAGYPRYATGLTSSRALAKTLVTGHGDVTTRFAVK